MLTGCNTLISINAQEVHHTGEKELRILTHSARKTQRTRTSIGSNWSLPLSAAQPLWVALHIQTLYSTQCHFPLFTLNSLPGIPSGGWTTAHILMKNTHSGIWSQLFWCFTHKSSSWTLLWEQDDCKPLHSSRDNSLGEKECVTADKHFSLCFVANHTVDIHAHTHRPNPAHMGVTPECYETTCKCFTKIWSHTMY